VGRVSLSVTGAGRAAAVLRRTGASIRQDMDLEMRSLGERLETVFAVAAPKGRTGRLSRGIRSVPSPGGFAIRADAQNPETGYDYVGVTRFGHRAAWIVPRQARALRFFIGRRMVFARRVRGYRPASDWVEDALPAVRAEEMAAVTRLGRRIDSRLGA
jgi:hypothetical protein